MDGFWLNDQQWKKLQLLLASKNVKAIIPNRRHRKQPYPFDAFIYKRRNVVERISCRLKDFRRILLPAMTG